MKTVFMTGTGGVLGKRLAAKLIADGARVYGLCRNLENREKMESKGIVPVMGDLFDPNSYREAVQTADAIFHLATAIPNVPIPNKAKHWALNDQIRIQGTQSLLAAAQGKSLHFYIPSVIMLYGNRNGNWVGANDAIPSDQPFMLRSAVAMENLIKDSNHIYTILRLGKFYSEDSHSTLGMLESLKKGKMPIPGSGVYHWNNVHVDDAASALYHVWTKSQAFNNQTLDITDFNPIPFGELVSKVSAQLGFPKPKKVPSFLAKWILGADVYKVVSDDYRVRKSDKLADWTPQHSDPVRALAACYLNG